MPVFSKQGLGLCRKAIERHVAAGYAPGAVALVACGDQVESFAAGTAEADGGRPMRRDTIFRIASMTKPITAAAVMMLIEDGRLSLDEPIDRLLPELADRRVLRSIDAEVDDTVPAARPITVRDLLTFQMGFGVVMAMPGTYPIQGAIEALDLAGFGMPDPRRPHDNDEWIRRLATLPLMAQPGTDWLYTTGSNVQGVLIARASGRSFGAFLEERILGPRGMGDTSLFVAAGKQERFVPAYQSVGGALAVFDDAATGGWSRPPPLEAGDSGLVSTVDDYLKFARLLLDRGRRGAKTLLSEQSVAAMSRNYLTPAQRAAGAPILAPASGWGFGMGVMVDDDDGEGIKSGTLHWTGGLGTSWFTDPASGLTAVVMTQRAFESPVLPGIHAEFQRAARKALA
jgi:CubicO group peptidase (beta-lactamase class C family)